MSTYRSSRRLSLLRSIEDTLLKARVLAPADHRVRHSTEECSVLMPTRNATEKWQNEQSVKEGNRVVPQKARNFWNSCSIIIIVFLS